MFSVFITHTQTQRKRERGKGIKEVFRDGGYVFNLYCGDGFHRCMHMSKHFKLYSLYMHSFVYIDHSSIKTVKNKIKNKARKEN